LDEECIEYSDWNRLPVFWEAGKLVVVFEPTPTLLSGFTVRMRES